MAKASQLLKGKRAVHRVRFPLVNFGCSLLPDVPDLAEQRKADEAAWQAEHPDEVAVESPEVGLRILTGFETAEVLEQARAFAKARGVEDPRPGDGEYQLGLWVYTLLLSCVDPDTANGPGDPEPFFDSAEQILNSTDLGRDGICYLAEQQELWQDQCSPQALTLTEEQLWEHIAELKGPDGLRFFGQLRPGMRLTLVTFLASRLLSLQIFKSELSCLDESNTTASKSGPKSSSKKSPARKTKPKRKAKAKPRRKR